VEIRKAQRKKAKLRLGISAPSGGGKTMSSLLLAFGITADWEKIGLIDTEAGSGELYVGAVADTPEGPVKIGEYLYLRIDPPYTAQKYLNAIKAFEQAGVDVIIEDSLSHAWAGAGGLLDKQGREADKTGNSYTAWRNVTPDHNALVDAILQSPCHQISTMRSKTEYVLETNDKGKQVPKKVGMAPVQRDGMEYEYTVFMDIDFKHVAHATKDRTNILKDQHFTISPATGKLLLDWLEKGVDEADLVITSANEAETLDELESIKTTKLQPLWPRLGKADRERIGEAFEKRKATLVTESNKELEAANSNAPGGAPTAQTAA